MALTSIQRVRLKIGDRVRLNRESNKGDGAAANFKLKFEPVQTSPTPEVWKNAALQTEGTDYDIDYDQGIVQFAVEPAANDDLVYQYYSVIYTDAEIQDFLDQYGDNVLLASGHILYAWAADFAKLAVRETLQGGGGLGAVTRDTSVSAKELRALAQAYLDYEIEHGAESGVDVPAEGLTEVPWTEPQHHEVTYQRFIRDN